MGRPIPPGASRRPARRHRCARARSGRPRGQCRPRQAAAPRRDRSGPRRAVEIVIGAVEVGAPAIVSLVDVPLAEVGRRPRSAPRTARRQRAATARAAWPTRAARPRARAADPRSASTRRSVPGTARTSRSRRARANRHPRSARRPRAPPQRTTERRARSAPPAPAPRATRTNRARPGIPSSPRNSSSTLWASRALVHALLASSPEVAVVEGAGSGSAATGSLSESSSATRQKSSRSEPALNAEPGGRACAPGALGPELLPAILDQPTGSPVASNKARDRRPTATAATRPRRRAVGASPRR